MLEGILVEVCNGRMPKIALRLNFVCLNSSVGPVLGRGSVGILGACPDFGDRERLRQIWMCPRGKMG